MHYFIKNTRNIVILASLLLVILAILGYSSLSLNAQGVLDPKALAEADARSYAEKQAEGLFAPIDVEEVAFSKDKSGCGTKAAMFVIMSNNYGSGASVDDVVTNKIFTPLVESVYEKIEKDGLEEATLNNMREYQDCIAKAKPHKDPSREYDLSLKHDACNELNTALLDTLDAIKKRRSIKHIVNKYERKEVDFSGTLYKDMPYPIILFIGKLYEVSKKSEYKNVVLTASGFSMACYG